MKDDDDKPSLPIAPPSLARAYIHPDKEQFSHYKKINVTYITITIHGYIDMV